MSSAQTASLLNAIYETLNEHLGDRKWWPGDSADEIIIGAVLTQNTSWQNVEKAIINLKALGWCNLQSLSMLTPEEIAPYIRPAGYFNLKARRLHAVADYFYPAGISRMEAIRNISTPELRSELLEVHGVGPETADSILLYALDRLTFVIDTYTLRIMSRHGLCAPDTTYHELKALFEDNFRSDLLSYNQFHALLVWVGAYHCKPTPRCSGCPLASERLCATREAWMAISARLG